MHVKPCESLNRPCRSETSLNYVETSLSLCYYLTKQLRFLSENDLAFHILV